MARFGVTVTYIATFHYVIKADNRDEAEDIGQEMSLEAEPMDYNLYDVESRQKDDDGPVDNED